MIEIWSSPSINWTWYSEVQVCEASRTVHIGQQYRKHNIRDAHPPFDRSWDFIAATGIHEGFRKSVGLDRPEDEGKAIAQTRNYVQETKTFDTKYYTILSMAD